VVELADRRNQWAGKLMSDGGARVIQVEPAGGSPGRWCGPFVNDEPDADRCLDYWWYNTGKQSVALDVTRRPAQEILRQMLARADVFIESTRPGTLAACGLDYTSVSSNKALIYASLTDFGQDGPWRDYEMNDHAHLALGGQMASSGYSDGSVTPIGGHGHQAWHLGCVFLLHGITIALIDRMTSGEGQYVDVSIHDCCALCTEGAVPQWLYNNATVYRQMGMHAAARRQPDLELPTLDGKYVMAMTASFSDPNWANMVKWMEEKGVAGELSDEKYRDSSVRALEYRQGTAIRDGIRRLVAATPGEEAFHRAQAMGITWAVINAPEENYSLRHYQEREFWRPVEHPEIGRSIPYPRGPYMSDDLQIEPRGRAPHLGEHTVEVLKEFLNFGDDQIAALAATGVIR
jgi:crotonobetainyl-CoA:carnitine CoA-transferase CaiB-like acyl-CoA transferase